MKKAGVVLVLLVALGCGRDAEYYMNEGEAYVRRGDMTNAVGMFEKAVEAEPSNYEAQNSLGAALSTIGDFERAVGHFRTAVAIDDSLVEGHYNLGRVLAEIGSYDEALTELGKVISLDSTYSLAYLTEGDIFSARKMGEQAAESYEKAIRFDPGLIIAYMRLSSVYVGAGEYDKAIDILLRARERRPQDAEIISMAGRAAVMKRDFEQAAQFLNEAVKIDSTNLWYRNDLATTLMLAGRRDEAVTQWRMILDGNPDPDLEQRVKDNLRRAESE
jgi:tetratricopeptide (TPR) repeat protein